MAYGDLCGQYTKQVVPEATCINSKLRGVFEIRDAWVQELRDKGQVDTVAIPREENHADILTHCLSSGNFNKEVGHINIKLLGIEI